MEANGLKSQFEKAGLPIKLVERARDVNASLRDARGRRSFLMDIQRRPREAFVVRIGDDADVNVVNVDSELQQLVLSVREREAWIDQVDQSAFPARVIRQIHVPESKRHFLVGMDECHLFAAPLPRAVSTVKAAHSLLKPESIAAQQRKGEKIIRQGEWFFRRVTDNFTLEEIEARAKKFGVQRRARVGGWDNGRRGRSHIVTERVEIPRMGEYVRGKVAHPDHHTITLNGWHQVTGNTETPAVLPGSTWID